MSTIPLTHEKWHLQASNHASTGPTPFGAELARLRGIQGVSQSKLAGRAGCDHSTISRLESGARDPTREMVDDLAAALGCTSRQHATLQLAAGFVPADLVETFALLASLPAPMRTQLEGLMRTMTGEDR
jgi:transcriptional regulator with XRE-family HTH domain